MQDPNEPVTITLGNISANSVSMNVQTDLIVISVDKLKIAFHERAELMKSADDWLVYASLAISFLVTILTSEFKNFIFPPSAWTVIFYISTASCAVIAAVKLVRRPKKQAVNDFIEILKSGDQT